MSLKHDTMTSVYNANSHLFCFRGLTSSPLRSASLFRGWGLGSKGEGLG